MPGSMKTSSGLIGFQSARDGEDTMIRDGSVAIVTGAGRGIGSAIALAYARQGARVVVNYSRSEVAAQELVAQIQSEGFCAIPMKADIDDLCQHQALIEAALDNFGRLDILVNNAAASARESFLEARPETWDLLFNVNLRGPYFLSKLAAQSMVNGSCGGKIINISSVHDIEPAVNCSAYCITKAGLLMLTKALALELASHHINVNAISPGAIHTDINRVVLASPAYRKSVLERIPCQRIGGVDDVAGAAVFLASAASDYITGTTIYVDGGMLLK